MKSKQLALSKEQKKQIRVEKSNEKKQLKFYNYTKLFRVIDGNCDGLDRYEINELKRQINKESITNVTKMGIKCIRIKLKIAGKERWVLNPISQEYKDQLLNTLVSTTYSNNLHQLLCQIKKNNFYWMGYSTEIKSFFNSYKQHLQSQQSIQQPIHNQHQSNHYYRQLDINNLNNSTNNNNNSKTSSNQDSGSISGSGSFSGSGSNNILCLNQNSKKKSLFLIQNNNSCLLKSISSDKVNHTRPSTNNNKNKNNNNNDNNNNNNNNINKTKIIEYNNSKNINYLKRLHSIVYPYESSPTSSQDQEINYDIDEPIQLPRPSPPPSVPKSRIFNIFSSIYNYFK